MTQTDKRKILLQIKHVERESAMSLEKAREQAKDMIVKAERKAGKILASVKEEAGGRASESLEKAQAEMEERTQTLLEMNRESIHAYRALGVMNRKSAEDLLLTEFWRRMDALS